MRSIHIQNLVRLPVTVAMATLKNLSFFHVFQRHNFFKVTRASEIFNLDPCSWYRCVEHKIPFQECLENFPIYLQNFSLAALKLWHLGQI